MLAKIRCPKPEGRIAVEAFPAGPGISLYGAEVRFHDTTTSHSLETEAA